jgi:hypothetical protein
VLEADHREGHNREEHRQLQQRGEELKSPSMSMRKLNA